MYVHEHEHKMNSVLREQTEELDVFQDLKAFLFTEFTDEPVFLSL